MVTSNFRQTIESLFAAFAGNADARPLRRPYLFGVICIAFGTGAAIGASATEISRAYSLAVPVTLLTIVLLQCERKPTEAETRFCESWFAERTRCRSVLSS
jgi:uncharacterized membrane protein YoaK (UPF0700 family)